MPDRVRLQGRFSFQGVSFGYTYWEPMAPNAIGVQSTGITDASGDLFAKLPGYGNTDSLVLLHGFGQSAQSWDSVVAVLDPLRPVWAFELLGHGKSDQPLEGQAYDLDFQGQALLAFLEALVQPAECETSLPGTDFRQECTEQARSGRVPYGVASRKLTLVGYSMGGRVALAAMVSPKRFARVVSCVVLESAGLGAPSSEARLEAARKDAFHANKLREEGIEAFFDYWETLPLFASQKSLSQQARQALRNERLRNSPCALAATFEHAGQHCMPLRDEVYKRLQAIQNQGVAVHYLVGTEDPKYQALAQEATQAIALCVTEVPGCGHNIHNELVAQNG